MFPVNCGPGLINSAALYRIPQFPFHSSSLNAALTFPFIMKRFCNIVSILFINFQSWRKEPKLQLIIQIYYPLSNTIAFFQEFLLLSCEDDFIDVCWSSKFGITINDFNAICLSVDSEHQLFINLVISLIKSFPILPVGNLNRFFCQIVSCICNPPKRRLNGRTVRVWIPSGERLLKYLSLNGPCNPI